MNFPSVFQLQSLDVFLRPAQCTVSCEIFWGLPLLPFLSSLCKLPSFSFISRTTDRSSTSTWCTQATSCLSWSSQCSVTQSSRAGRGKWGKPPLTTALRRYNHRDDTNTHTHSESGLCTCQLFLTAETIASLAGGAVRGLASWIPRAVSELWHGLMKERVGENIYQLPIEPWEYSKGHARSVNALLSQCWVSPTKDIQVPVSCRVNIGRTPSSVCFVCSHRLFMLCHYERKVQTTSEGCRLTCILL